ncbi:hypothetical protein PBCV1_a524L [Paramecium bursaria Chlorella virus 1]|uniref:Uncharacterized protein n=1 Tax=Paramecium bursaria Chlorella virus 1 TaxID=10506 RepID=Q98574_PBCV1|nr:hypothetical protein PBCV1_a524L [Paramecium bursaria Chlorella virus 1]AAC96891.1 hypothetical protein [Paramecium bursaria Chlorella virus 1]
MNDLSSICVRTRLPLRDDSKPRSNWFDAGMLYTSPSPLPRYGEVPQSSVLTSLKPPSDFLHALVVFWTTTSPYIAAASPDRPIWTSPQIAWFFAWVGCVSVITCLYG